MKSKKNIALIILAGGKGVRYGGKIPKQYTTINGSEPVYIQSLKPFLKACKGALASVTLVCPQIYIPLTQKQIRKHVKTSIPISLVPGGPERISSLFNAIKHLIDEGSEADMVMVHDAVRPLIHPTDILGLVDYFIAHALDAALITKKLPESLFMKKGSCVICVNRDDYYLGESPDLFSFAMLRSVYAQWKDKIKGLHSSVNILELISHTKKYRVGGYEGKKINMKLTFPHDQHIIKKYVTTAPRKKTRG